MDKIDSKILNLIQEEFPLCSRPHQFLGKKLGLSEKEVFERIKRLKKEKFIRRIGAAFDTKKMGWKTTLVAMKVSRQQLNKVAKIVNSYSEVNHNYLRSGSPFPYAQERDEYNLWFTLACPDEKAIKRIIEEIREKTESAQGLMNLPATNIFKLRTYFKVK